MGILTKGVLISVIPHFPTSFQSVLSRASSLSFSFNIFFYDMRILKIYIQGSDWKLPTRDLWK